jgi:hypothetical protein
MVTLAADAPAVAEAETDAPLDFDALAVELVLELFFEQPDRAATTIVAPATATKNPRFTGISPFSVSRSVNSANRPQQYGCRVSGGLANGGKQPGMS